MTCRRRSSPLARLVVAVFAAALVCAVFSGAPLGAATRITTPSANPYHVALDPNGEPVAFTVVAEGLPAGRQAFIEQCDDRAPSAPNWSVTRDCDLGGSPAPVIVDAHGVARFDANDRNHGFRPVIGASPQALFNCMKPGTPAPANGLTTFTRCQIRVSTNNVQETDDQVFFSIVFGAGSSAGGSGSTAVVFGVVAAALFLAALATYVVARRRGRPVRTA
jgi:hypothetical protein